MTPESIDILLRAVGQLGVPVVILFGMMFGMWKAAKFLAPLIATAFGEHSKFLQVLEGSLVSISRATAETHERVKRIEHVVIKD